jgi:hypothetical protein
MSAVIVSQTSGGVVDRVQNGSIDFKFTLYGSRVGEQVCNCEVRECKDSLKG